MLQMITNLCKKLKSLTNDNVNQFIFSVVFYTPLLPEPSKYIHVNY